MENEVTGAIEVTEVAEPTEEVFDVFIGRMKSTK